MRLLSLAGCFLAALGLAGCLSTHHEEYAATATWGAGPGGVEATRDGTHSTRDWQGPWLAQPDRARP
jgi:hypothetical protein